MTDLLPDRIQALTTSEQQLMTWLLLLAAVAVLLYLLRTPLRSLREQHRIKRAVRRISPRLVHNANLPDGMGGEIHIDFLVLSADAILVIDVKSYDGMIFGSASTDEWTQTINSRSYRFPNPDIHLAQQLGAVRTIVPKVPVRGLHLFTDTATFPWDRPDNVRQVKDLLDWDITHPGTGDIPADLRTAWTQLLKSIQT
jgi:hypothetical protein